MAAIERRIGIVVVHVMQDKAGVGDALDSRMMLPCLSGTIVSDKDVLTRERLTKCPSFGRVKSPPVSPYDVLTCASGYSQ